MCLMDREEGPCKEQDLRILSAQFTPDGSALLEMGTGKPVLAGLITSNGYFIGC